LRAVWGAKATTSVYLVEFLSSENEIGEGDVRAGTGGTRCG
jgi:hypothetical protein